MQNFPDKTSQNLCFVFFFYVYSLWLHLIMNEATWKHGIVYRAMQWIDFEQQEAHETFWE